MKKRFFATGFASVLLLAASAQTDKRVPPPPPPVPAEAIEAPPPEPPQIPAGFDAFLKRNPSIKNVHWRNDEIVFRLKSGKEERYNLADEKSRKDAEAKYGELPDAPPPPPPPPPPAPPAPPKPPKQSGVLS